MTEQPSWTDERTEALRALNADGLSAWEIAKELGGITRNAVIGKLHRLGIVKTKVVVSAPPPPPKSRLRPKPNFATIPNLLPAEPAPRWEPREDETPDFGNIPLGDLKSSQCHWPRGEGSIEDPFRFCGRESLAGFSYCAGHARLSVAIGSRHRGRVLILL
jgi:GcrA cell cycle regulator